MAEFKHKINLKAMQLNTEKMFLNKMKPPFFIHVVSFQLRILKLNIMTKQKKIEELIHEINIETILKVLWAIKDKDQFYFVNYGKELFDNLIKQKPYRKKDLIEFYEFIKKECDIVNTSGYAETHVNWFLEKRKRSN